MGLLLDTLRSVSFLQDVPEDVVVRFMVLGKSRDFAKGHVFWKTGTQPQGVVIPVTGEAKAVTRSEDGREFIDALVGPGECLGLEVAVDGMPHPTDGEVVRAGEFFTLTYKSFQQFVREQPDLGPKLVANVGRLYRRSLREREEIALRPMNQRVAGFLLDNACLRQADGAKVLVDATQGEIAARLGSVREVVARIFGQFVDRGLIEKTRQGMFIADWEGLHSEAGREPPPTADDDTFFVPSPELRTARFFLSAGDRRKGGISNDATACKEHLGDLSLCREKGCPAGDEGTTSAS